MDDVIRFMNVSMAEVACYQHESWCRWVRFALPTIGRRTAEELWSPSHQCGLELHTNRFLYSLCTFKKFNNVQPMPAFKHPPTLALRRFSLVVFAVFAGFIGIIFLLSFAFSVSFGCVEGFDVGIDVVCHQLDTCRPITDVGVRDGVCWGERRPDKVA